MPVTVKPSPDSGFPYTTVTEFGTICKGAFTIVIDPDVYEIEPYFAALPASAKEAADGTSAYVPTRVGAVALGP
jgi:hypothetical protein